MKKLVILLLSIVMVLTMCACDKAEPKESETNENPYTLLNGYAPSEMLDITKDFILNIYAPFSQKSIDKAINELSKIATVGEIEELKNTVGAYDASKKATVANLKISICTPDNSSNYKYKIAATFTVKTDSISQNMLIEFKLNDKHLIESHSIWLQNPEIN